MFLEMDKNKDRYISPKEAQRYYEKTIRNSSKRMLEKKNSE
jgi:hypothetical protein|tara:strand:- start:475 stop:597 length:123 start_codon:yes stop_codon:yes gene_type:complete